VDLEGCSLFVLRRTHHVAVGFVIALPGVPHYAVA